MSNFLYSRESKNRRQNFPITFQNVTDFQNSFSGKGVGSNSLQCTRCQKWVHKKCSGIKGSMSKVAKSFICRGCVNPVTSAVRTSVDLGLVQSWS